MVGDGYGWRWLGMVGNGEGLVMVGDGYGW